MLVVVAAAGGPALSSSIGLSSSSNPVTLGQPLTLTATVTAGASGKVAFYDGTTMLGISPLSAGKATFKTALASGAHSLRGYYGGDATYLSSSSAPLAQTVSPVPSNGFLPPVSYPIPAQSYLLAVADLRGDGKADLVVTTPYGNSNSVSVLLGNGDGTFQPAVSYLAGSDPYAVAVGDFNGDGKPDLAVANYRDVSVSVLLGNGDGTFQPAVGYAVGMRALCIAAGDFNGDGKADLVVGGSAVFVLLGNGDGTFQGAVSYAAGQYPSSPPTSLAVADFNGDGKADLAVANQSVVGIFLGNGDGSLQPMVSYVAGPDPISVAVADFNGDGKPDLAVANPAGLGSSSLSVLLGNGDGTFQKALYATFNGASSVTVADIYGNGKADLIASSTENGVVGVLPGNGDGTFGPAVTIFAGPGISSAAVADFNGDGKADVAVAGDSVNILLGGVFPDLSIGITHFGNFVPGTNGGDQYDVTVSNLPFAPTNGAVTVSDTLPPGLTAATISGYGWSCAFNNLTCTRSDILAAGASYPTIFITVSVSNNAPAILTNTATVSGGGEADLANDKAIDTIVIRTSTMVLATGATTVGQPVYMGAFVTPKAATGQVTFYDGITVLGVSTLVNGEAYLATALPAAGSHTMHARYDPDAASLYPSCSSANVIQYVAPVAANGFQPVATYAVPASSYVVMADFSGDGKTDLALNAKGVVMVLLGHGDGTFGPALSSAAGLQAGPMAVADFNGDGKPDLVVASYDGLGDGSVNVLLGRGDGTFQAPLAYATRNDVSSVAVADFNGDGSADIAYVAGGVTLGLLLGNGDGTFQSGPTYLLSDSQSYPSGNQVLAMVVGDFNGDGKADVALATYPSGITVLLGNGDGSLQTGLNYTSLGGATSLVMGDFNGDGRPDLAVSFSSSPGMTVLLLGKGDGTFQAAPNQYSGTPMAVCDLNGDGKLDLVLSGTGNSVQVLAGNGDGTFLAPVIVPSGGTTRAVAVGDLNGDGRPDLAMANDGSGNVGVVLGSEVIQTFSEIGVYRPTSGAPNTSMAFYLDSSGTNEWGATDKVRFFGVTGIPGVTLNDTPVAETGMAPASSDSASSIVPFPARLAHAPGSSTSTITANGMVWPAAMRLGPTSASPATFR